MRLVKKTVILAKTETTPGVDAIPTGAANAIKAFDMSVVPLELTSTQIETMSSYFGGAMTLPGASYMSCTFSVLLAGSGTAATAPAWGALITACACSETTGLTTPNRVEYLTATDLLKTSSIYYSDDGVIHKLLGCFGNPKVSAKAGDKGMITFDFIGIDGGSAVAANPTAVLTAWRDPVAITAENVTDITLGCTYAAGALSGGTAYNSNGLTFDFGNSVEFSPMLTVEEIVLDGRKIKGSYGVELSPAQEVATKASIKARTAQSLGFVLGKTSGNKIMLYMPAMVQTDYKPSELKGKRIFDITFELDPVVGNDELRIVCL